MGAEASVSLVQSGFVPVGGGIIECEIQPFAKLIRPTRATVCPSDLLGVGSVPTSVNAKALREVIFVLRLES